MFNNLPNLGAFPIVCKNCENEQLYNLVDYPKEPICKNCGNSFEFSECENEEIQYLFSQFLALEHPDFSAKLKPLCSLLQKAINEKKPYIRFYSVKDPSEKSSFPLLAVFAAKCDKDEEYSYIGCVKSW